MLVKNFKPSTFVLMLYFAETLSCLVITPVFAHEILCVSSKTFHRRTLWQFKLFGNFEFQKEKK